MSAASTATPRIRNRTRKMVAEEQPVGSTSIGRRAGGAQHRLEGVRKGVMVPIDDQLDQILAWLERRASRRTREGMARYGIVATKAFGVSMAELRRKAREHGPDYRLAAALWKTGWYEGRMLAALVDEPARVTPTQMDRWARAFDNWAICDTTCFQLFDKTPHAWSRIHSWAARPEEFVKRAAFALVASLGVHDKHASDEPFTRVLPLILRGARDDRNFVKKAVSWALRVIGRRSPALNAASIDLASRLVASDMPSARWVGRDALRELTSPRVESLIASTPRRRPIKGRPKGRDVRRARR